MPAQVVVVKRSRRRVFAFLSVVSAWLRAVFTSLRATERGGAVVDLEGFDVFRDIGLLAPERLSGIRFPYLEENADPEGCRGCARCVEVCPSDALELKRTATSAPYAVDHFEFDPGRCIGCGECARICPAKHLGMKLGEDRVGLESGPAKRSLLFENAPMARN